MSPPPGDMQHHETQRLEVDSGLEASFPQTFTADKSLAARAAAIRDAIIDEAQEYVGLVTRLTETNAPVGAEKSVPFKVIDAFTIVMQDGSPPELLTVLLMQSGSKGDEILPHLIPHDRADLLGARLTMHLEKFLNQKYSSAFSHEVIAAENEQRELRRNTIHKIALSGLAGVAVVGALWGGVHAIQNRPSLENSGLLTSSGNIKLEELKPQQVILIQGKEIRFEARVQMLDNEPSRISRDGTITLHRYKLVSVNSGEVLPVKPIWYGRGLENGGHYKINGYVRDSSMPLFMNHVFFEKVNK